MPKSGNAIPISFYVNRTLRICQHHTPVPRARATSHFIPGRAYSMKGAQLDRIGTLWWSIWKAMLLPVSRRGFQSSENSLTHINVANGHCPLQLEFYFQLPTLVLRTAEPRSSRTIWVQQVLHRILGILSQREKENIRTFTEPKAKEDAQEEGSLHSQTFPGILT